MHFPHGNPAGIGGIVQRRNLQLQGSLVFHGRIKIIHNGIQQMRHVVGGILPIGTHPPLF